jgi:hypothetical protein
VGKGFDWALACCWVSGFECPAASCTIVEPAASADLLSNLKLFAALQIAALLSIAQPIAVCY